MKNLGKEDEYIRQFISELGTEEPSVDFRKSILNRLNQKKSISVYRPVISTLAWKVIGGAIAVLFISVLVFVPGGSDATPIFDQLPDVAVPNITISLPRISLPVIQLSPIVIQSLVVFILLAFLTVIASLKKQKIL